MARVLLLLNMGGARSESELKEFLLNMFKDERIIPNPLRFILSPIIANKRYKEVWKSYEEIGGSPIYELTDKLVSKLQNRLDYKVRAVMRYTKPNAHEVLKEFSKIDELFLFPLYPHFSLTTTQSSYDDVYSALRKLRIKPKIRKIDFYYDKKEYNKSVIEKIKKEYMPNSHLIFSAHGLPVKLAKKDEYEKQVNSHVEILKRVLKKRGWLLMR